METRLVAVTTARAVPPQSTIQMARPTNVDPAVRRGRRIGVPNLARRLRDIAAIAAAVALLLASGCSTYAYVPTDVFASIGTDSTAIRGLDLRCRPASVTLSSDVRGAQRYGVWTMVDVPDRRRSEFAAGTALVALGSVFTISGAHLWRTRHRGVDEDALFGGFERAVPGVGLLTSGVATLITSTVFWVRGSRAAPVVVGPEFVDVPGPTPCARYAEGP